ncbi:hypothetical protein SLNSH_21330 [Alsobacter soli]|uniref:Uncharacterized protein n=1 Tax=Alsobacter soli TaxID=2109933 RepID=A0A2T1HMS9_9HYPH|nr:hypothetical protein [Alsobacter soli]PSC02933.1 hypothetical protein SLNSH_21330 [Alsobacter soli]
MKLGLAACAFASCVVASPTAISHDFWINRGQYKDPTSGVHCCGPSDCSSVTPARITVVKDGYLIDGQELVPFAEAYTSEDHDFWRCKRADGSRRCFFAPTMSF